MTAFKLFLPEVSTVSLYELLAESDRIMPRRSFAEATVFDPCAARDNRQMQSAIRALAGKAEISLEELREPNRCCGYGGHIKVANHQLYQEITRNRANAGEKPYIVYCANCLEVFRSLGKESVHILDIALGLILSPRSQLSSKRGTIVLR